METKQKAAWPEWMSIPTAAKYSDVSARTVGRWLNAGLPSTKPTSTSNTRRINRRVLDRWLENEAVAS